MKKLLILFAFIPALLIAQPGTPDTNGTITAGPPDWVTGISTGGGEMALQLAYVYGLIDTNTTDIAALELREETYHAFVYFGDSTISLSYTTAWAQLTNVSDSLFIQFELDGFAMSGDTITITTGGDYTFAGIFTHDGDNGETVSLRFYNVTQTAGIPVAGASTTRAANNFMSTPINGYYDINAGDKIVVQYKGDANGTAVFKNGSILIVKIHE